MKQAENLLKTILFANQNFFGTVCEMQLFIAQNPKIFDKPQFQHGEWLQYSINRVEYSGVFQHYCVAGINKGLAVLVKDGRFHYVAPDKLRRTFLYHI